MNIARLLLAMGAFALVFGSIGTADEVEETGMFAAPKRIMVGEKFLGEKRYYPSPVLYDVDGDGVKEIVVGDLFGKVTVASGKPGLSLAIEKPMMDRDGKPLKFHNW